MAYDFDGKAALVTASGSGLRKASARALARNGADLVVNGRNEDRLAEAVEELSSEGDGTVAG
jgi:3-oxoacyl-[acyl-carrier protein] reductase